MKTWLTDSKKHNSLKNFIKQIWDEMVTRQTKCKRKLRIVELVLLGQTQQNTTIIRKYCMFLDIFKEEHYKTF